MSLMVGIIHAAELFPSKIGGMSPYLLSLILISAFAGTLSFFSVADSEQVDAAQWYVNKSFKGNSLFGIEARIITNDWYDTGIKYTPTCSFECHLPIEVKYNGTFMPSSIVFSTANISTVISKLNASDSIAVSEIRWLLNESGNQTFNVTLESCSNVTTNGTEEKICSYSSYSYSKYVESYRWVALPSSVTLEKNKFSAIDIVGRRSLKLGERFQSDVIPSFYGFQFSEFAWWNSSFDYRTNYTISINSPIALPGGDTNAFFPIEVDTATLTTAKMQADCDDNDWVNQTNKEPRWQYENYTSGTYGCDTAKTVQWFYGPVSVTNGTTIMSDYYGYTSDVGKNNASSLNDDILQIIYFSSVGNLSEEGNLTTFTDSSGRLGVGASLAGGVSADSVMVDGLYGKAFYNDGTRTARLSLASQSSLFKNLGQHTSFAVFMVKDTGVSYIWANRVAPEGLAWFIDGANYRCYYNDGQDEPASITTIETNKWYVGACRFSANNRTDAYLLSVEDGFETGSDTAGVGATINAGGGSVMIAGEANDGAGDKLNGYLDFLVHVNRTMDDAEVKATMLLLMTRNYSLISAQSEETVFNAPITSATEPAADPATYLFGRVYNFTATVRDDDGIGDISHVIFETSICGSLRNITASNALSNTSLNSTSSTFNASLRDCGVVSSGAWRWYANDSTSRNNAVLSGTYTIDKASLSNNMTAFINGGRANFTTTYPNVTNATAVFNASGASDLIVHLYHNDTNFTAKNNTYQVFGAGINYLRAGTTQATLENYTVENYTLAQLTMDRGITVRFDNFSDNVSSQVINDTGEFRVFWFDDVNNFGINDLQYYIFSWNASDSDSDGIADAFANDSAVSIANGSWSNVTKVVPAVAENRTIAWRIYTNATTSANTSLVNQNASTTVTFEVTGEPPSISGVASSPSCIEINGPISISWTQDDNNDIQDSYCQFDAPNSGSTNVTSTSQNKGSASCSKGLNETGDWLIEVFATDPVGNRRVSGFSTNVRASGQCGSGGGTQQGGGGGGGSVTQEEVVLIEQCLPGYIYNTTSKECVLKPITEETVPLRRIERSFFEPIQVNGKDLALTLGGRSIDVTPAVLVVIATGAFGIVATAQGKSYVRRLGRFKLSRATKR